MIDPTGELGFLVPALAALAKLIAGAVTVIGGGAAALTTTEALIIGTAVLGTAVIATTAMTSNSSGSSSNKRCKKNLSRKIRDKIEQLRNGNDVEVDSIEEAKEILDNIHDIKPYTEINRTPNPSEMMRDGFNQPNGTYRGDLINKSAPTEAVHPNVGNPNHANYPHYNIRFPNGTKAAIIIK